MMFDFNSPDLFTTGTTGRPGNRVFFLQVVEQGRIVSFRLEKQQVEALADSLEGILDDVGESADDDADDLGLVEPPAAEWTVGVLGVAYDASADRILVAAQELPSGDADDVSEPSEPGDLAAARVLLTRAQASAFVHRARTVVEAGRPVCLFCGRPRDPEGHACPRMN